MCVILPVTTFRKPKIKNKRKRIPFVKQFTEKACFRDFKECFSLLFWAKILGVSS